MPHILNLVIVNNTFVESVEHLAPLGKTNNVFIDIVYNFSLHIPDVKHKLNFSMGINKNKQINKKIKEQC